MLTPALVVLGAVALGGLFLFSTRSGGLAPAGRRRLLLAHGLGAAAAIVLVLLAAGGPGATGRLYAAAAVLAGTAAGGLMVRVLQKRGQRPTADLVVMLHAAGALLGFGLVILSVPRA